MELLVDLVAYIQYSISNSFVVSLALCKQMLTEEGNRVAITLTIQYDLVHLSRERPQHRGTQSMYFIAWMNHNVPTQICSDPLGQA
jgi:hypothetical protein